MRMKYKAILFDMDGVIVDSMTYHYVSWFEALMKCDVRITPTDIFEYEGSKWDQVIAFAFNRQKKKLTKKLAKQIAEERKELFSKHFKRYIFTGIYEMLQKLKRHNFILGLVTGSSLAEAKKMLPKEIYNIFDVIVAGDMLKRGKPYPDPYLHAAKELGLKSSDCLAIENAPYGIRSAKAAQMDCFVIATSLPKESLSKADKVFNNHQELYEYFKKHL